MDVCNFGHNSDFDYFGKYPYLVRKVISMWVRIKDIFRHARVFPMNTLMFSISIVFYGLRSAVRGE